MDNYTFYVLMWYGFVIMICVLFWSSKPSIEEVGE